MPGNVDALLLREWLHDGDEIAVLDVRDGGPYSRSHILVASSAPLAQLETSVPALVPRRSTRTVLVDDGGDEAVRAAALMERAGYTDLHVLEGGNPAWESTGFLLFSGSGIISKAFGEMVEHELDTPAIDPETVAKWQQDGTRFHLFDSRPMAEYRTVSLPGVPDAVYGEVGAAFVVCEQGHTVDADSLKAWCKERLAGYKVPKSFAVREDLPLLPIGKVDKQALKRLHGGG
ncbi:MAG: rhodanese-like domain-containing protein [Acidimicrobiales bacterium]